MSPTYRRFPAATLHRFTVDVLRRLEVPDEDAALAADALLRADLFGIDSHGVARLGTHPSYVPGLRRKLVNPRPSPRVLAQKAATLLLDGDRGLGVVIATRAMRLAIERARAAGIGAVAVTGTHHFGIASHYALMAVEEGMIGVATTNSYPQTVPTYGKVAMLGTNPLSIAAPAGRERPFLLDMATSVVSAGKVDTTARAGKPIPVGWIVDADGLDTTDAPTLWKGGALLPLGSSPELASYKGYGLGVAVDVLCGVLSGAGYGPILDPVAWTTGHFMLAIDISAFRALPLFAEMMDAMIQGLRRTPAVAGQERVLALGDREYAALAEREREGIPLHPATIASLRALAEEFGVPLAGA